MSTDYKVDFQQVKERVAFGEAMQLLGLKLRPDGPNAWRGACPACKSSDARSFRVTEGKGWYCHAAKKGGDVIALACHVRGLKPLDAAKLLNGNGDAVAATGSGDAPANRSNGSPSTVRQRQSFSPEEYARELKADHEALQGLGLSPETLERFQAGYRANGRLAGRLAVRIDDAQGNFSTFVGIALKGEEPSRMYGHDNYDPGRIVFGAHRASGGEVRLVRDVVEVMAIWEQTGEDCVCFLTELVSSEQHDLLSAIQQEKRFLCYY